MMKQMTIKKKITLWYTGIIALILGMVLGFMFYFVDKVGISATEEEVSTAVTGFSSNFQFQDGTYYLSEDTKFYEDGVMFCVYDDNGKLLYGTMPEKFPKQTMLKSHTPRVIKSGSSKWMVYDSVYTYGQNKDQGNHIHSCNRSIYDNISENDARFISIVYFIDRNDRIFYVETCIKTS